MLARKRRMRFPEYCGEVVCGMGGFVYMNRWDGEGQVLME
jgi:hypothetical protein